MHELPVTHEILEIVLKHSQRNNVSKVHKVFLEIGAMSDLEQEWIQRYFTTISEGTVAEGAQIEVQQVPCRFMCRQCGTVFIIDITSDENVLCPACGSTEADMISGSEYTVKSMEAI